LVTLLFSMSALAQIKDNAIEKIMSQRVLTDDDISYNAAILIPRLYKENKIDTLNALIDYYEKNYETGSTIAPYILISKIKNRTFKEQLENKAPVDSPKYSRLTDSAFYLENICDPFLTWYLYSYDIEHNSTYPEYIRTAYGAYFNFIRSLAREELRSPGHTHVEQFLLRFFADPSDSMFKELNNPDYNGTQLQRSWYEYHKKRTAISGFDWGLTTGMWVPDGHLAVVGNHPYLGYVIGGKSNKWIYDLALNFSFLRSPNSYIVNISNVNYTTNYFFGYYVGIDFGYELARAKRNEIDLLAGMALAGFQELSLNNPYYNTSNSNSDAGSVSSLDVNAGIGYKYYLTFHKEKGKDEKNSYLAIQVKYHYLQLNNVGTDLLGNAWTIGLIYGAYSRKASHYNSDIVNQSEK